MGDKFSFSCTFERNISKKKQTLKAYDGQESFQSTNGHHAISVASVAPLIYLSPQFKFRPWSNLPDFPCNPAPFAPTAEWTSASAVSGSSQSPERPVWPSRMGSSAMLILGTLFSSSSSSFWKSFHVPATAFLCLRCEQPLMQAPTACANIGRPRNTSPADNGSERRPSPSGNRTRRHSQQISIGCRIRICSRNGSTTVVRASSVRSSSTNWAKLSLTWSRI